MRTVVALGGNALCEGGEPTIAEQRERIATTVERLDSLRAQGHDLVVTHGNGPQVGQLLRQQETDGAHPRPLDVLAVETQAQIGYLLQQAVDEQFPGRGVSVVAQSVVDSDDPAFETPTEPIGPFYTESEARERAFETAAVETPAGKPAYRRVVALPNPTDVLESGQIHTLVESGTTVICGGGGGVPVVRDDGITGVEAVVDKDHTTARIAAGVDAELVVMATDVDYAYTDFGTPEEEALTAVDPETMREHPDAGEFREGSMRPEGRMVPRVPRCGRRPRGHRVHRGRGGAGGGRDGDADAGVMNRVPGKSAQTP